MGGTLSPFSDAYARSFFCPFFTSIELCYTKALEWSSLVSSPKAKSSLEIRNPTPFTISYHSPTPFPYPCFPKHWITGEVFLYKNWSEVDLQLTSIPPNPRRFWKYFISFSISSHPLPIFPFRSFISEIKEIGIFFLMNYKFMSLFVVGIGFPSEVCHVDFFF